jgi:phosphoribosylaminoimidazolecarboxamide formyltransferase/IMP cyclohydrolase
MKRALISVSNKEGIIEFAKDLIALGYEIISTGGTAKTLLEQGINVIPVKDVTGFKEILEGRVKTLHPYIHGGILAKREEMHLAQLEALGIKPIDLVVVNLYPFKETISKEHVTFNEAIENIDIGGPTMVRAAAKNHQYIGIIVNPKRYNQIIQTLKEEENLGAELRLELAYEAFAHTAEYDMLISQYLGRFLNEDFPQKYFLQGDPVKKLRYGENPQQKAYLYKTSEEHSLANGVLWQGKELSFNNLMDLEAAYKLVGEFMEPACAIIKHTNPCGVALGENLEEAYLKALKVDEVSAFGGIVAFNQIVSEEVAEQLTHIFLEAVIAPEYSKKALEKLQKKPNLRVLQCELAKKQTEEIKTINGGFLVQERDTEDYKTLTLKTTKQASEQEIQDLEFAWKVVKHVKSNAIVVAKDQVAIGMGIGQTNRIGSAKLALEQAGESAQGAILASDAFFPFRDTVDFASAYGITAIIQPGGSLRDVESIEACEEHHIAMVFTGIRHFKH